MEEIKMNDSLKELDEESITKVSGGLCFTIECERCGKDLTEDEANILGKNLDTGSDVINYWCCPDCVEDGEGFKHFYVPKEIIDPITGDKTFDWVKTDEKLEYI